MTRKHFAMIAQVIKETGASPEARANLAQRFASELATTNANFNKALFLKACGC
mgnify:CR=1 FL=1